VVVEDPHPNAARSKKKAKSTAGAKTTDRVTWADLSGKHSDDECASLAASSMSSGTTFLGSGFLLNSDGKSIRDKPTDPIAKCGVDGPTGEDNVGPRPEAPVGAVATALTLPLRSTGPLPTRDRLVAFYNRHKPKMLNGIDRILEKYEGWEDELFDRLVRKYGSEPNDDDESSYASSAASSMSSGTAFLGSGFLLNSDGDATNKDGVDDDDDDDANRANFDSVTHQVISGDYLECQGNKIREDDSWITLELIARQWKKIQAPETVKFLKSDVREVNYDDMLSTISVKNAEVEDPALFEYEQQCWKCSKCGKSNENDGSYCNNMNSGVKCNTVRPCENMNQGWGDIFPKV
jgi:hypothetical protein